MVMTYFKAMEPLIEAKFEVGKLSVQLARLKEEGGEREKEKEKEKVELWRRLTCHTLARWLAHVYGACLVALSIGCYETILARHGYLQQVLIEGGVTRFLPLEWEEEREGREEIRRLVEIVVNEGVGLLCEALLNATRAHFATLDPTQELTPAAFASLLTHLRHDIEHSLGKNLIEEIMAPPVAMHLHLGLTRSVVEEYRAQLPQLEGLLSLLVTDLIDTTLVNHLSPLPLAKIVARAGKAHQTLYAQVNPLIRAIREEDGVIAVHLAELFTQFDHLDLCVK